VGRPCSICTHEERESIDRDLLKGVSYRRIAARTGAAATSLRRHKHAHLAAAMAAGAQRRERAITETAIELAQDDARGAVLHAAGLRAELEQCFLRLRKMFDAADRWLTDPAEPSEYWLGPRSEDVGVVYVEMVGDPPLPVRSREKLSTLLERLADAGQVGDSLVTVEVRHADIRTLALGIAKRMESSMSLVGKLIGELDERTVVAIQSTPEWPKLRQLLMDVVAAHPETRELIRGRLRELSDS